MTTKSGTNEAVDRELALHRRLEKWLLTIATEEETDSIGIHLGDLYGACEKLGDLIANLPDLDPIRDRERIRQDLMLIHVEIYSHMLPHMENLRSGLDEWMQRLFDEVPDEPEETG
jgi:hypothetical protein